MSTKTELVLSGRAPLRRTLQLFATRAPGDRVYLCAIVYPIGSRAKMIAYARESVTESRLALSEDGENCLWVGRAAFDISAAEAEKIRETFLPLGLRLTPLVPL